MRELENTLARYWGPDWQLRSQQPEIVGSLIQGRDVMALLPTGEGKSLCFQLAGLVLQGVTMVVSPLIALMQDQVASLQARGIPVLHLHSQLSRFERDSRLQALLASGGFVYLSPEQLQGQSVRSFFWQQPPRLLVIDEAHCISQWGHDFRPAYRRIPEFVRGLPQRPVIGAFTATAPERTAGDISQLLQLQSPLVVRGIPLQQHIRLQVRHCWTPRGKWRALLQELRPKTLIYASSRLETEVLTQRLAAKAAGPVLCYHAGMSGPRRQQALETFATAGQVLMVATKAFGMGVDIGNIARVIHWQLPESLSAYVQEVGRAGRNRQIEASALLLQAFGENAPAEGFAQLLALRPDQIRAILAVLEQKQSLASLRQRFQLTDAALNQLLLPLEEIGILESKGDNFQLRAAPDKATAQTVRQRIEELKQRRRQDLSQLRAYIRSRRCRRQFLYRAFDLDPEQKGCGACDRCGKKLTVNS